MFVISTRNFPPDVGGIQNLIEGLSIALLQHGPVKVFADKFNDQESYDKYSKINIERVAGFKIFRKYRKANLLHDFIKNNNVRALFFDHWKSIENINQNTLDNSPSFCLIHSKEINHPIGSSINLRMRKSLKKAKFIISNSAFTKNLAIKLGVDKDKIKTINPGCNYPKEIKEDFIKQADVLFKDAFPKIITVARLDKRKNHQNILMTIKNLKPKYPKIKYISLGNGDEKINLLKLKKELGLKDEINFIHNSDEQLKLALINKSDLFLMPSIIHKKSVEGFGISFIEAASYGKASIGGNKGGEGDAIENGKTGYICDGDDLSSIYGTMIKVFENDNFKKLGLNALQFSKRFKWENIIKKYLNLI